MIHIYINSKKFNEIIKKFYEKWGVEKNIYEYDLYKKYVYAMYEYIVNTLKYSNYTSIKLENIEKVLKDNYFNKAVKEANGISRENKALLITCIAGKLKNKYLTYLIFKVFIRLVKKRIEIYN